MIEVESLLQSGQPFARDLLDVDAMSAHLSRLDELSGARVATAAVIRHSPGKRLVVAYGVTGGDAEWQLIGKAYPDPARASRLHAALETLYAERTVEASSARPVALIPELRLSLQERAGGVTLDALTGAARAEAIARAARWLSALHRRAITFERRLNLASEMRKVGEWAALITGADRASAAAATRLAKRIDAIAGRLDINGSAPIHKDFQYGHVFAEPGRVTVIDLDEVRAGDPALDVAHFCAYLHLLSLREQVPRPTALQQQRTFLDAYGGAPGGDAELRHRFFYAHSCLKIAKQLVRGRAPAPVPRGAEVSAQIALVLREGLWTVE